MPLYGWYACKCMSNLFNRFVFNAFHDLSVLCKCMNKSCATLYISFYVQTLNCKIWLYMNYDVAQTSLHVDKRHSIHNTWAPLYWSSIDERLDTTAKFVKDDYWLQCKDVTYLGSLVHGFRSNQSYQTGKIVRPKQPVHLYGFELTATGSGSEELSIQLQNLEQEVRICFLIFKTAYLQRLTDCNIYKF